MKTGKIHDDTVKCKVLLSWIGFRMPFRQHPDDIEDVEVLSFSVFKSALSPAIQTPHRYSVDDFWISIPNVPEQFRSELHKPGFGWSITSPFQSHRTDQILWSQRSESEQDVFRFQILSRYLRLAIDQILFRILEVFKSFAESRRLGTSKMKVKLFPEQSPRCHFNENAENFLNPCQPNLSPTQPTPCFFR